MQNLKKILHLKSLSFWERLGEGFVFLCLFSLSLPSFAQNTEEQLTIYNDSLTKYAPLILNGENDSVKQQAQIITHRLFKTALAIQGSFKHEFDSLPTVAILMSPDKRFRIINWLYRNNDGTFKYYGFIQTYHRRKGSKVYELFDNSENITNPLNANLNYKNWYGSLYYDIILKKRRGKRYYTLLSFDGNDNYTTKKIIDVLYFSRGIPKFGKSILKYEKKTYKRLIFEYSAQVAVSVRYNKGQKMIIFDHIAPDNPKNDGNFRNYGPDGSYDGLKFKRGKWQYIEDVDARNDRKNNPKKGRKPEMGLSK